MPTPCVLTHGGVGSPAAWSDGTLTAAQAAWAALGEGADALAAALAATDVLEDDPRFNAGTGARLRLDGRCELDAAVMTDDGRWGAVTCLQEVRHPARVAALVRGSPHRLLAGEGATRFAHARGVPRYDPSTPKARRQLAEDRRRLERGDLREPEAPWRDFDWSGTIGTVVRDRRGRCAAAGSTGGTSLMLPGRVGDTPLIGCGFYAGAAGAVVATGHGEAIADRHICLSVYRALAEGLAADEACRRQVAAWPRAGGLSLGLLAVSAEGWGEAATHEMAWSLMSAT